jgi:hypothetical protein
MIDPFDPLELIEAQESFVAAREELAALLVRPKMKPDDRTFLIDACAWLEESGAPRLNLRQFCADKNHDYEATKKRIQRLRRKAA